MHNDEDSTSTLSIKAAPKSFNMEWTKHYKEKTRGVGRGGSKEGHETVSP